nr:hypothetical protein [Actinomycetota bacterium]
LVTLAAALLLLAVGILRPRFNRRHPTGALDTAGRKGSGNPVPHRPSWVGATAVPIRGVTPNGDPVDVDIDGSVMVAFLTSSCLTCQPVWSALGEPAKPGPRATAVVVTPSPSTESAPAIRAFRIGTVPVVMSSDGWHAYAVTGAPWCVRIDGGVVTAELRPQSTSDVFRLLAG